MTSLPTQSFNQIVSSTIAGIQGRAAKLTNFSIGSTLRAIVEGFAGLFLWFQALVLQLLQACRLSTATGVDVDTFTADFMPTIGTFNNTLSPRLGAQSASGEVTFSRFTAGPNSCFVPVGATVKTTDGTQSYAVVPNATYPTYSAVPTPGYTLPSSVASFNVPVTAVVPGSAGNIVAGSISQMTSTVVGIDNVNNIADYTNGADFESDAALKKRFADYILGLSRGDVYGLTAAIEGAGVTVQWTLTEDYNFDGSYRPGYFLVVVDDGSGSPSPSFVQTVTDAIYTVRPLSVQVGVFLPTTLFADVSMQITTAANIDHNFVVAEVAAALATNIDSLGLGVPLPWSILSSWAYDVTGVVSVQNVLLNGNTGDIASLITTKPTLDGFTTINYITIKAGIVIVS